jgi:hypothetical protein
MALVRRAVHPLARLPMESAALTPIPHRRLVRRPLAVALVAKVVALGTGRWVVGTGLRLYLAMAVVAVGRTRGPECWVEMEHLEK